MLEGNDTDREKAPLVDISEAHKILDKFAKEEESEENNYFLTELNKIRLEIIDKIPKDPTAIFLLNNKTSTATKPKVDQEVIIDREQGYLKIKYLATEGETVQINWRPKKQPGEKEQEQFTAKIIKNGFFNISKVVFNPITDITTTEKSILMIKEKNLSPNTLEIVQELRQAADLYTK
jgi:hypothetical protein